MVVPSLALERTRAPPTLTTIFLGGGPCLVGCQNKRQQVALDPVSEREGPVKFSWPVNQLAFNLLPSPLTPSSPTTISPSQECKPSYIASLSPPSMTNIIPHRSSNRAQIPQ